MEQNPVKFTYPSRGPINISDNWPRFSRADKKI